MSYAGTQRRYTARRGQQLSGYRQEGTRLGNPLAVASAAVAVFQNASSVLSSIGNIFSGGGGTRDAKRQARATIFRDAALSGCVTAARYLLGGLSNVGGNEVSWYRDAWNRVQSQRGDVAQQAQLLGGQWVASDNAEDPPERQQMIVNVARELETLQRAAAADGGIAYTPTPLNTSGLTGGSSGSSANPTSGAGGGMARTTAQLPAMTTTAPYNWLPWAIGGGVGLVFLVLGRKH